MSNSDQHITVFRTEAVAALEVKPDGFYVDCTFGRGGHSKLILAELGAEGQLLAMDKDRDAVNFAKDNIKDARFRIVHESFVNLPQVLDRQKADGILLDLGVSSPQLDDPGRGFSFMHDGPLDMRMNQDLNATAADWINTATEFDLADVIYKYGEERQSRKIARAIVRTRKDKLFTTTNELATCIKKIKPKYSRKHPATKTFQALRIFINKELSELKDLLSNITDLLQIGARLVVISFHSLEDRIVKQALRAECAQQLPKEIPLQPRIFCRLSEIFKLKASAAMVRQNPRARSAIMRVARRQN